MPTHELQCLALLYHTLCACADARAIMTAPLADQRGLAEDGGAWTLAGGRLDRWWRRWIYSRLWLISLVSPYHPSCKAHRGCRCSPTNRRQANRRCFGSIRTAPAHTTTKQWATRFVRKTGGTSTMLHAVCCTMLSKAPPSSIHHPAFVRRLLPLTHKYYRSLEFSPPPGLWINPPY